MKKAVWPSVTEGEDLAMGLEVICGYDKFILTRSDFQLF